MQKRKDGGVEAPISLGGLFNDSDDSGGDEQTSVHEIQTLTIGGMQLRINQTGFHIANANKVWPGTFVLADFLLQNRERYLVGDLFLELGSATGALAILLRKQQQPVITSDIDDGGEAEKNIKYNFELNGEDPESCNHIAHTWGKGFFADCNAAFPQKQKLFSSHCSIVDQCTHSQHSSSDIVASRLRFVVASDILLYVSAYDQLVETLCELISTSGEISSPGGQEFLMSWNRRMKGSQLFFDKMSDAGFHCYHHGKCIYSFFRQDALEADAYYQQILADCQKATRDDVGKYFREARK